MSIAIPYRGTEPMKWPLTAIRGDVAHLPLSFQRQAEQRTATQSKAVSRSEGSGSCTIADQLDESLQRLVPGTEERNQGSRARMSIASLKGVSEDDRRWGSYIDDANRDPHVDIMINAGQRISIKHRRAIYPGIHLP